MKYLVMQCRRSYAVLLDEQGRFVKAANLHYAVGQQVTDPVLMRQPPARAHHPARWITGGLAAVAACLVLLFGLGRYQDYNTAYASIYLSINPAVQLTLNRQGAVIGLQGTNADGQTLLEGYYGRGKDKLTVTDELIDRAIQMGFLAEGGQVSFAIDAPDQVQFERYGVELREHMAVYLDGRMTVSVEIVQHRADAPSWEESAPPVPATPEPAVSPAAQPDFPPAGQDDDDRPDDDSHDDSDEDDRPDDGDSDEDDDSDEDHDSDEGNDSDEDHDSDEDDDED